LEAYWLRDVRTNEAGSGESHWGERESVLRQRTDAVKQKLDDSISLAAVINMAWEHGEPDFQSRFDKFTAQAQEMKVGRCGFCEAC